MIQTTEVLQDQDENKVIELPVAIFESLSNSCDLLSIVEKGIIKHIVSINGESYCIYGSSGTGTGIGWESHLAYKAVFLKDYTGDKQPLSYQAHFNEVNEGKRQRSYDGLLLQFKKESMVLLGPEIKIIPQHSEEKIKNITTSNNKDMNFFEQLQQQPEVDITIRIMKKNERLTLNVMPGSGNSITHPIIVTGTGAELDEEFFPTVFPGVKEVAGMISNLEDVKKEAAKRANTKQEPAATKEKAKSVAKKAEQQKVEEPNLFPVV